MLQLILATTAQGFGVGFGRVPFMTEASEGIGFREIWAPSCLSY